MAKKQTRRTISFNRVVYDRVSEVAECAGISASEWVTRLIHAALPELPPTYHESMEYFQTAKQPKPPAKPVNAMSSAQVAAILAPKPEPTDRRADVLARNPHLAPIEPWKMCAACTAYPATHRERVPPYYAICDKCEEEAKL